MDQKKLRADIVLIRINKVIENKNFIEIDNNLILQTFIKLEKVPQNLK